MLYIVYLLHLQSVTTYSLSMADLCRGQCLTMLKFGRIKLTVNEKIMLASMFHS